MEQKYPKTVEANADNDLLFRSTAVIPKDPNKKKQGSKDDPMVESGPNTGKLEYFTE